MIDAYADRWALVTGASSGIGAEFARVLAARGMHLILTARRRDLMEQLAEELHTRHGTRCEILVSDLGNPTAASELVAAIERKGLPVELLVNNAGFAVVGEIEGIDPERVLEMLRVNIIALTELTYRLLPPMLERGHGAIINLSSVAAFQPVAFMGGYAASKAFVLHLSEALWAEARDRGVTVTALCPGVTRTAFFDVAGVPGWLKKQPSQTPEQVVKTALRALEKRQQYTVSGWKNYLLSLAVRIAPRRTVVRESMKYFRPRRKKKDRATEKPQDESPSSGPPETAKAGEPSQPAG